MDLSSTVQHEERYLRKVHPTPQDIPSCLALFDTFLACNVVAFQLKSLYRHGHTAVCTQKWDDFKFCLKNNSLPPEQKYDAWIRRRAEWWAARRLARSSEDVWEFRSEPLPNFPPHSENLSCDAPTIG